MSAIAGIYHLNYEPANPEHGTILMDTLQKYPADDIGVWQQDSLFLGCHAQWITPESVGERLPYYDCVRRLAITADAIIDNRDELFQRLQVDYGQRNGMPDSQLILLAYCKWGEEAPKYLAGDFAFMIWDEGKRQLFGARDFSGSRTLYYFTDTQRFAFCTAMEPLLSLPYIGRRLNEDWLAEFLAIPGMQDATDSYASVYKNIYQIPPAHSVTVIGERVNFKRYCTSVPEAPLRFKTDAEYEEAFRDVFQLAVREQIRTHRLVGTRLSGGLDSGAVASFAAKALRDENKQLHTFSYVPVSDFEDWTPRSRVADESPFIRSTVSYIGNIKDMYMDFKEKNSYTEINDWLEMLEMPYKFFENSFWIKGLYETAHQEGIGILLNGGRGNYTISWGHALDYYALLLRRLSLYRFYQELQLFSRNRGLGKKYLLSIIGKKAFPMIKIFLPPEEHYQFPMLIHPELAKKTCVFEKLLQQGIDVTGASEINVYEARKSHFIRSNSWNLAGTSKSKISLRYSLWDRDPTNDIRVVKFCLSVPEEQYVKNGFDRALIRRATESFLPDNVRLNMQVRGIQGADGVHRMKGVWSLFLEEIQQLTEAPEISELINLGVVKAAAARFQEGPRSEYVIAADYKVLMRSLIVYRFLKKYLKGGDKYA